jgi:hypothetical protein
LKAATKQQEAATKLQELKVKSEFEASTKLQEAAEKFLQFCCSVRFGFNF